MRKRKTARAKRFGLPHRDYSLRRKDLEPSFKCDFPDIESGATDMGKIGSETRIPSGSDHVTISIAGNDKQSSTALCSITAARRKLPIVLIPKGKTI
jgi:hypothetical protein